MRLIVTRPREDAGKLIAALEHQGHRAWSAPMITIEPLPAAEIPQDNWQAILVTSANSVRALAKQAMFSDLLKTPVLAVGPASARAATNAGFTSVTSADADLPALTQLARQRLAPSKGPLLYPSGAVISGDLKSLLEQEGFCCTRVPLYDAVPAQTLPVDLINIIHEGQVDGVLLFSPRTARVWARCIEKAGEQPAASRLTHWCLSKAVADALCKEVPTWSVARSVMVAPQPNEESLLTAIGTK